MRQVTSLGANRAFATHFNLVKKRQSAKTYWTVIHTKRSGMLTQNVRPNLLSEITNITVEMEISKEELQNKVGGLSRKENRAVASNYSSERGSKARRCKVRILCTQKSSSKCAYLKGWNIESF